MVGNATFRADLPVPGGGGLGMSPPRRRPEPVRTSRCDDPLEYADVAAERGYGPFTGTVVGVAQSGRAPRCGRGCRGFESRHSPHSCPVGVVARACVARGEGSDDRHDCRNQQRRPPTDPELRGCAETLRHCQDEGLSPCDESGGQTDADGDDDLLTSAPSPPKREPDDHCDDDQCGRTRQACQPTVPPGPDSDRFRRDSREADLSRRASGSRQHGYAEQRCEKRDDENRPPVACQVGKPTAR